VYDKFHVLQHANKAIDEVRRAECFRKGGRMRGVVKVVQENTNEKED
jgi:transposase